MRSKLLVASGVFQTLFNSVGTIRQMVDYSSVTVTVGYACFSNNQIFSLNLTFPNVPQYPHIF